VTNPFYSEITVAAEAELMEHGYTALIGNILLGDRKSEECTEENYVKTFLEHRVDGLLFTSTHLDSTIGELLGKQDVTFVLLNRRFRSLSTNYVGVDNVGGMRAATDHLIKLGHRRIGFVGGFSYSSSAQDRFKGYLSALEAHGIESQAGLFVEGDYDLDSGHKAANQLLSLPTESRPTAICAANDLLALGIIDYAINDGLRIPDDLSITGFDDIPLARIAPIGLTTVRQPLRELGCAAARLLVDRIERSNSDKQTNIVLPCELVVRKTTMSPA
jgi:LacI family transcriptional regulator, galactose operon repressor